jgi:hypothetical protein
MATRHRILTFPFPSFLWILSVFLCVPLWILSPSTFAQDASDQEVAVNLAEGRVVICAAKDGIILAAMDAHGEAGSLPPDIAILSAERMGVMLGAVEWVQPDSKDKPVRLDNELRGLIAAALNTAGQKDAGFRASDIESIGIAVLERLRELAGLLHHKINLGEDEPLIRIVLVGHVHDYGPEAWTIDYHIRAGTASAGRQPVAGPSRTERSITRHIRPGCLPRGHAPISRGRTPSAMIFGGRGCCVRATSSFILRKRASLKRSLRSAIRRRTAHPVS